VAAKWNLPHLDHLEGDELEALLLETRDDVADQPPLHRIRFHLVERETCVYYEIEKGKERCVPMATMHSPWRGFGVWVLWCRIKF
jgi:hypothetical protein